MKDYEAILSAIETEIGAEALVKTLLQREVSEKCHVAAQISNDQDGIYTQSDRDFIASL